VRRIAVQIALSFLALTLLTVGIGAVAAVLLGRLGGAVTETLEENVRSVVAAERMARALDAAEAARLREDSTAAATADRVFRDALAAARTAAVLPEEPALLDTLDAAFGAYRAGAVPVAAVDQLRGRLLTLNERAAAERAARAEAAGQRARRFLLFAVACAVGASVLAGALLARRITRPLRALTAGVAEVGRGHFRQRVAAGAGGEVGALARAFNEMAERLEAYEALNLRALLREKRTAESLVAAIPSPVVVTEGPDARVRLVNAAAERALGNPAVGRPLADVAPDVARAARSSADGPDPLVDLADGGDARTFRLRRTEVDVPPPDDGAEVEGPDRLGVLLLDDVTPFRALDAARRDFLAAVSHELRTPLTSMHVAADLLLRDAAGPLTEDQRELAAIVKGDAERMKVLTARLLDLARVEVGGRPAGPVDLAEVARGAAEGVRLVAAERGVAVAVEAAGAPVVEGDADGLAMAASNLVANAVRHAASRVVVRAEAADGGALLAVTDDGPGLPDGAEDRVFEPLVQLGEPGDAPGGHGSAGLGLTIVRRVAEAHGGRAWAEPGPGGRFFVSLPPPAPGPSS
jgi:signal transduction histidine kinase/HAMP domain-containing protein